MQLKLQYTRILNGEEYMKLDISEWLESSKVNLKNDIKELEVFELDEEIDSDRHVEATVDQLDNDDSQLIFKVFSNHPDRFHPNSSKQSSFQNVTTFENLNFPE